MPNSEDQLRANITRIAAYTTRFPELRDAHHWLYDSRYPMDGAPEFVVLGINPGETPEDWKMAPQPTEETSRFDFHDRAAPGRSSGRWARAAQYFLDDCDYVLAEVFFWSSADTVQFKRRYGALERSPHLAFCAELNRELIDIYQPRAVVAAGLQHAQVCQRLHGLRHEETVRSPKGHRLVERFSDGQRAWIFTKHWSGAFGFSTAEREIVRAHIQRWSAPRRLRQPAPDFA